ncbi:MAG: polysaccharide deacetylase family protein [Planctomycetes bacterium]|nr:polysaccharide deacetylase family protein [Planctomycetota bacterium]
MDSDGLKRDGAGTDSPANVDRSAIAVSPQSDDTQILAVMYHYISEPDRALSRGVQALSVDGFRAQLDDLCRHMEPIDWPSFYGWTQGRVDLPKRCFLLTFDDGLLSHGRIVLPVLEALGLRGVFFVPTSVLTHEHMLLAHAIHLLLSRLGDKGLCEALLAALHAHDASVDWPSTMDTNAAMELYHYESRDRAKLKYFLNITLPISIRQSMVQSLFEQHVGSIKRWSRTWYLGWEDLVAMQALGHSIGGHGDSHEPITCLTTAQGRADIRQTACVLNDGLGPDIRPFSYPFGRYDEATMSSCREAGFAACFTTEPHRIRCDTDTRRLPRVDTMNVTAVLEKDFACQPH